MEATLADSYKDSERSFLMRDAAHCSLRVGFGANAGIGDALDLAHKLACIN